MGRFSCPYYSTLWASVAKGFRIRCYYRGRDNNIYGISSGPEHDYLPAPIDDAGTPEPLFEKDNNKVATPEDSPVIIIANDDDEEDAEEEIEDVEDMYDGKVVDTSISSSTMYMVPK
ncbi:hypothetical protein TIFTF001_051027 [Ficus carica]|uniref:Uncharacterized protein n=1 Tax=Ficus carica TaxID=3494 RepID=A0AA88CKU7_FICCA|nr:hypothetical protein TIFTF001_051018 [Ficus carica]GMN20371.1 hypothetical protein TIFTF001_051021 [Ficus carica]GMN20382.1 hypothetical protein TIFTF001_051024 [Ficus carica]GMN20396.1 hypothetical protein TIFTF001_051027 [Ficus carica]